MQIEVNDLASRQLALEDRVTALEQSPTFTTFIASLGAEEIAVVKPIPVTVRRDEDEYVASFLDANISSGGTTAEEAIANLQSLIADCFDAIDDSEPKGKSMARQTIVLKEMLCRR